MIQRTDFTFWTPFLLLIAGGILLAGCGTTPVEITAVDGPDELEVNEEGTFEAAINEDAGEPLEFSWEFGDGTTAAGLMATHAYSQEGEYEVTFTASNPENEVSETLSVTVIEPVPAEIVTVNASPSPATEGEAVEFTSNIQGDEPLDYEWDFGDGNMSTDASPTHTYDEPGEYEVALNLSNPHGEDSRTLALEVEPALADICFEITEFNAAFFDRNSSELTDEGRDALDENADILGECPNLNVRVEGMASQFERNADQLSDDRASAIAQYYEDAGISSTRIDAMGLGAAEEATKKAGDDEFRRADSIPVEN